MADVTISDLTPRQPTGAAVIPYSENGTTYQSTASQLVSLASGIPAGVIVMWSGSIASIPTGWALCNGTNGTPDLRNQFIIGASVDVSGQSQTGVTGANTKTGGSKDSIVVSHTHTINDPGHAHKIPTNINYYSGNGFTQGIYLPRYQSQNVDTSTSTTGITINSEGSSGTNANLPPYFALAYIMKL